MNHNTVELPQRLPIYGDDNPENLMVFATIGKINSLIRIGVLSKAAAMALTPINHWEYLGEEPNAENN